MLRPIIRLLVIAHILMPLGAALLILQMFAQIRSDVTPLFENASSRITRATDALGTELNALGDNFAPLANAVNATQRALQTILNFLRDTVFTVIDVVNTINPACSIGRVGCIGKSLNVQLPTVIDLTFIDEIGANINTVTSEIDAVVSGTTAAISGYSNLLVLALVLFAAWVVTSGVLFYVMLYSNLWRQA